MNILKKISVLFIMIISTILLLSSINETPSEVSDEVSTLSYTQYYQRESTKNFDLGIHVYGDWYNSSRNKKWTTSVSLNGAGYLKELTMDNDGVITGGTVLTSAENITISKYAGTGSFSYSTSGANFGIGTTYIQNDYHTEQIITLKRHEDVVLTVTGLEEGSTRTNKSVLITLQTFDNFYGEYVIEETKLYSTEGFHTYTYPSTGISLEFTIDKTSPVLTLTDANNNIVNNNDTALNSVTPTFIEGKAQIIGGDNAVDMTIKSGTVISDPGRYTITLTDSAGNVTTMVFTIQIPPIIDDSNFINGMYYNKDYTIIPYATHGLKTTSCYFEHNGQKNYFDESLTHNRTIPVANEGINTIVLVDTEGNVSTFTINMDQTLPTIITEGTTLINNSYFNKVGITTIISDINLSTFNITHNSIDKTDSLITQIDNQTAEVYTTEAGIYVITAKDKAGNNITRTYHVTYDAPVIFNDYGTDLKSNCDAIENIINSPIQFWWTNDNYTVKKNGQTYRSEELIEDEGLYTILVTDKAGNSIEYNFIIDYGNPEGTLTTSSGDFLEGFITTGRVTFTFSESGSIATLFNNITSINYDKSFTISTDGIYQIILTDAAGNYTEYNFIIDNTVPSITPLYKDGTILTEDFTLTGITSGFSGIKSSTVYYTDSDDQTSSWNINVGDILSEGSYTIIIILNNEKEFSVSFFVMKDAPIISNINESLYYNKDFNMEFYSPLTIDFDKCYIEYNDVKNYMSSQNELLNRKILINNYGANTVYLVDSEGKEQYYIIYMDSKLPTIDIEEDGNSNYYKTDVNITFSDDYLDSVKIKYNNDILISEVELNVIQMSYTFTNQGTYEIEILDRAGNKSTSTIYILKDKPTVFIDHNATQLYQNHCETIEGTIYFYWDSLLNYTSLLNDKSYKSGDIISEDGLYELIITDRAGNFSRYIFIIDNEEPVGTLKVNNGTDELIDGITTKSINFIFTEVGATATLNGIEYISNTKIEDDGIYEIVLTDAAGNTVIYNFIIDSTSLFLEHNANKDKMTQAVIFTNLVHGVSGIKSAIIIINGEEQELELLKEYDTIGTYSILIEGNNGSSYSLDFEIVKIATTDVAIDSNNISAISTAIISIIGGTIVLLFIIQKKRSKNKNPLL